MVQPFVSDPPPRPVQAQRVTALLVFIAYWVGWELMARAGLFYEGVVPSSVAILRALYDILLARALYENFAVTTFEVVLAVAVGGAVGVACGLLGGAARVIREAYEPYVRYLAPMPKIVFLPLLLLLFGVGMESRVALGALSAFFPMTIATLAGVRTVSPVLLRVGRGFNLSRLQMALKIYLPALRAPVVTGLKLAFGFALIGVMLAEIKVADSGLGCMARQYYDRSQIAELYALLMIVFLVAAGGNALLDRLMPPGSERSPQIG